MPLWLYDSSGSNKRRIQKQWDSSHIIQFHSLSIVKPTEFYSDDGHNVKTKHKRKKNREETIGFRVKVPLASTSFLIIRALWTCH